METNKYYAQFAKGYILFSKGLCKESAKIATKVYKSVDIELYVHMAKMLIMMEKIKIIEQLQHSEQTTNVSYTVGEHNVYRYAYSPLKESFVYGARSMGKVYEDEKDYEIARALYKCAVGEKNFVNKSLMGFIMSSSEDANVKRCTKKINDRNNKRKNDGNVTKRKIDIDHKETSKKSSDDKTSEDKPLDKKSKP